MEFFTAVLVIVLIIVIVATAGYFARWMYKNEHMSQGVAKTYERLANGATYMKNKHWTAANDLYEKTSGYTYDDVADLAFKKTLKREQMHAQNEAQGALSPANMADAMGTAYILGNLYNYNMPDAPNGEINAITAAATANFYYNRALSRIITNPDATINTPMGRPTVEDVVDRAQGFYEQPAAAGGAVAATDDTQATVFDFGRLRGVIRAARVATAIKKVPKDSILPVKMAAIENYYENRLVPNDPQNVHDSAFNDEMSDLFKAIVEANKSTSSGSPVRLKSKISDDALLAEITYAINHSDRDHGRKSRALQILDRMKAGANISSLNTNERQLIVETWKRTYAPENEAVPGKVADLQAAIIDGLADGMESRELGKWSEVCVTGRCSRVLGALTLIDANEKIAAPLKTTAILRKEIMEHAYKTLSDVVAAADPAVAEQYQGLKPVTNQAAVNALEADIGIKIEESIRHNYSHINPRTLEPLIQDAKAGI